MVTMATLLLVLASLTMVTAKVSLYLSSDQTEALYGIQTPGLYYITEGVVNKYAMNFQHQVIPAEVDHIDFTWSAKKGSAVPYKITFMHAPSRAMANPSVNISTEGIVPTHTDKFRLFFPCTGKVAEQVETLFQISFSIRRKSPEVLNFKRIKVCKLSETPAEELVSDPLSRAEEGEPVLLSSVSPSLFVVLGAVSASVILLTVVMAALYVRTVRKRDATLRAGESLRSSLQLGSEEADYMEKFPGPALGPAPARPPHQGSHCTVTMSSSDSYDTLASFTQVPVTRPEAGPGHGWAGGNDYAAPLAPYSKPSSHASWRSAGSPMLPRPHPGHAHSSSLQAGRIWSGSAQLGERLGRVQPLASSHHYQYTSVAQAEARPGEASPYSVSSELYKHVLHPGYSRYTGGSVLV